MEKATSAEYAAVEPAALVEKYQAGIWRYLRALGCDASLADDLTQDTFVIVLQKPFEQFSDAATASFLRRVAHNLFISHRRRAGKVTAVEDIELFESYWLEWVHDDSGEELVDFAQGMLNATNQTSVNGVEHEVSRSTCSQRNR